MITEKHQAPQLPQNAVTSSVLTLEQLCYAFANNHPIMYFDDERELLHNNCRIVELREDEATITNGEYQYEVSFDDFQLLLRPLSFLIDNILEDGNDENYNLSCELAELLNTNDCSHFVKALIENKYYAVDVRLWNDVEKWLDENNFDWRFNLIKNELAIEFPQRFS